MNVNIIRLDEVDSTNLYAERLISKEETPEGTVVAAAFQSAGKGQGDNTWESERGKNLTFTLILRPVFLPAGEQFHLNMAVTLGVIDFARSLGVEAAVKWPNDIHAGGKKIAGLLISHRVSGTMLEYTIAGIGINLNQEVFPATLPDAASVKMITGKEVPPDSALDAILGSLRERYLQLREEDPGQIRAEYLSCLKGYGKWQEFESGGSRFEGMITGVDEYGRLLVESRNGITAAHSHGTIRF
jgi:BirA family biotin operon repressor/biotin-[acetyl-CoA-carboxylase] ligase